MGYDARRQRREQLLQEIRHLSVEIAEGNATEQCRARIQAARAEVAWLNPEYDVDWGGDRCIPDTEACRLSLPKWCAALHEAARIVQRYAGGPE